MPLFSKKFRKQGRHPIHDVRKLQKLSVELCHPTSTVYKIFSLQKYILATWSNWQKAIEQEYNILFRKLLFIEKGISFGVRLFSWLGHFFIKISALWKTPPKQIEWTWASTAASLRHVVDCVTKIYAICMDHQLKASPVF